MTLTASGLTIKTQPQIEAEIRAELKASPQLNPDGRSNLGPDSDIGVITSIISDQIADREQLTQAVYASQFLFSAEGASLDGVVAMRGVSRLPASSSRATLTLGGVNGTVIPAGSRVRDPNRTTIEWLTLNGVTIVGGTATVVAQAAITGPIAANTGTLTQIVTPVAGWNTVTNAVDAVVGSDVETDEALRRRFIQMLSAPGQTQAAAIRAAVLQVAGVTEVSVYENLQAYGTQNGLPPRSIEVIVTGGANNDIATAIHRKKSAGMYSYSATGTSGVVTGNDAQGIPYGLALDGNSTTIAFSRPIPVNVWIYVEVVRGASASDVEAALKTALAAFGNQALTGATVARSRFIPEAYKVTGVDNVRRLAISRVGQPGPSTPAADFTADVFMAFRERPVFDTSRIVVAFV